MVNYKEILRLLHEGYSQREIERSLHMSRRPCQVLCVNSRTTSGKLCDVAKRNRRVCQVTRPNHHPIGYPAYRG